MVTTNAQSELYQLAYTSTAVNRLPKEELDILLHKARKANTDCFITGVLLYKNDKFLQVLEGDKDTVKHLFEKIKKDARHVDVELILVNPISSRVFPDWVLGIAVEDEDFTKIPPYFSLVSIVPFCVRSMHASADLIKTLSKFLD